jgi:SAM-dependent methyltransferase
VAKRGVTDAARERAARIDELAYDYRDRDLEAVVACNLCGSTNHVQVSRRDRYGYPAVMRVCARCGLGFLSPRLAAAEYADFYARVYRPLVSAYHGRLIDAETVQVEQREYAAELLGFLQQHLTATPADVLDIGGSTGVVAAAVRSAFGSAVTVLDPAPDELAVAGTAGLETVEGFAEDFEPGGRRWQLVLLCQTIDHLLDVSATLKAVRALLADGGRFFVDVLDVEFTARRCGSIEGAVKIDHPYYLTRATACGYFACVGLEIVAERMADDGHWGFLLTPGNPPEPDWDKLREEAESFLDFLWRLRARG